MTSHARGPGTLGAPRKRKERDASGHARPQLASSAEPAKDNNRLLAGYLAHEFLTRGTLLGKSLGPDRADPGKMGPAEPVGTYKEASYLLMRGGAHVPGVVNPTELARWLRM
ncbi:hypothetical protein OPV22_007226 [Ensete ventricosum]|uniref:Uncharacterized protein n=1 Tax=Ensete ventricosum TaxID=4639 RepID=A0AAV8RUH2_ENSVE|nr:hypothetical protein OPV22_007226 [Ensete ventricosum]RWW13624.1 hypothetical protein GW17_00022646 [Ensete ventricosum]RWW74782.1 hypothetical protein BHE74_00017257 [Ensete ventricosum]RZR96182.1 hypothetical protein BHM03_00025147 [Ensete ventricosum]